MKELNETKKRIELNKDLKARLLNTIIKGYIDLDEFPEIEAAINRGRTGFWFLPCMHKLDNDTNESLI